MMFLTDTSDIKGEDAVSASSSYKEKSDDIRITVKYSAIEFFSHKYHKVCVQEWSKCLPANSGQPTKALIKAMR